MWVVLLVLLWSLPAWGAAPTLTVTPAQSVVVKVTEGPATPLDWLGLFPVGAPDNQWVDWFRLNGTKYAPAGGFVIGGATFKLPATGGPWEIRLFKSTGYANRIVTSAPFGALPNLTLNMGPNFTGWVGDARCLQSPMVVLADLTCTATFAGP
jgi:hypothetical protein